MVLRRRTPFAHPAVEVEDCVGFKRARVGVEADGRLVLEGVTGVTYAVSDRARCARGRTHAVPDPSCSCGFHAWRDPQRARRYLSRFEELEDPQLVLVQVECWGEILEFRDGLRAAGQDVLELRFPHECSQCPAPATLLRPAPDPLWVRDALPRAPRYLEGVCVDHAGPEVCTLGELASQLGAECCFDHSS